MSQCVVIDIDGTLSPPLVSLLNLLPDEILRIVVTARLQVPGAFSSTWRELNDMGLRFDEMHMRQHNAVPPGRFKAKVVEKLRGWGVETLLALDDDHSVVCFYQQVGVPVVTVTQT